MEAVIGQWYINRHGTHFKVVATDNIEHTIEVQFFDGTLDEIDAYAWRRYAQEETEPPEDFSGSLDITADDFVVASTFASKRDWQDPLDYIDLEYVEPEISQLQFVTSEEPK